MAVIKVENLSKQYRLGNVGLGSLSHDLNRWYQTVLRGREDPYLKIGETNDRASKGESEYVWALRDINFDVKQGEVLGIIGRNGAGKSTLLKILSRTTGPTTGSIKIKGRVASLLEVGTGFHPELTGRENIFLNGAILGMTKQEIRSKFDEIVAFAGVERYVDTPVKRYSSGMYVRLAFAVAAHLEPEILIVDEVLAVGDVEFQKKAIGKMKEVSEGQGRTVLFVSHNMASLQSLCTKGLLLLDGKMETMGTIQQAINAYENKYTKALNAEWENVNYSGASVFLQSLKIVNAQGISQTSFLNSDELFIEMNFKVSKPQQHVKIGFDLIKNDQTAFRSQQVDTSTLTSFEKGNHSLICKIPKHLLNEGEYFVKPLFSIHCVKDLLGIDEVVANFNIKLDVTISDYHSILHENNHPGLVYPFLEWKANKSV